MNQVRPAGIWSSAIVWGLLWAPGVVLLETLFDWHKTGHLDSAEDIVAKLALFMVVGALCGLVLPRFRDLRGTATVMRLGSTAQVVLFILLMLLLLAGLAWMWIAKV